MRRAGGLSLCLLRISGHGHQLAVVQALDAEQLMVPGLEGLQQPLPDLSAPNSWRMSRPL